MFDLVSNPKQCHIPGMTIFVLAALAVTVASVFAAQRMAANRSRSPRSWMWSAALLGPLPLALLAVLPPRRSTHS
jgi:hypothetical protein